MAHRLQPLVRRQAYPSNDTLRRWTTWHTEHRSVAVACDRSTRLCSYPSPLMRTQHVWRHGDGGLGAGRKQDQPESPCNPKK